MRIFCIAVSLFLGAGICIWLLLENMIKQSEKQNTQQQIITDLQNVIKRGNKTIMMADSVIKANTIYVGPKVHDTVYVYKDTVYIYRWLTDKKFKHAK